MPGAESGSKSSQRVKTIGKNALHLKSTWARTPIYDQAYFGKPLIDSPGNPVGGMKSSLLLLIVQSDKKSLEESTKIKETYFFDNFQQYIHAKSPLAVKIPIKTHCWVYCVIYSSIQVIFITLGRAERAEL